jgi:6-phosphogluconolactonase (cycloisomerase 2 family)
MGMKFAGFIGLLVLVGLGLVACSTSKSSNSASTGVLYVASQADSSVSIFSGNLSTGILSSLGTKVTTGNKPSAMIESPDGKTLFVANSQDNTISSYSVNADGTLAAASGTTATGTTPSGLAMDGAGKFLLVANQGTFGDPTSGTVSVYSVSGATLTPVGSYATEDPSALVGNGPVSVAVAPNGNYAYTADQFSNTISAFSVDASGALTPLGVFSYNAGNNPSAVTTTPDGNFVLVANHGSNNVSVFAACTSATLSCVTPDGHLTQVSGSPFSVGLGPTALTIDAGSQGQYLFVADYNSNQVSAFRLGTQTGSLTALSPPTVSTGANPVAVAVLHGTTTVAASGGTTNYVYVANQGGGTISVFSYDTTAGALSGVGTSVATLGQPSALAP